MARRPRFLLALVALVGLMTALVAWLLLPTRSRVNPENFARIQMGMTEAEVAELLGGSPDQWEDVARLPEEDRVVVAGWDEPRPWIGDECVLVVRFFDGQVTDKELHMRGTAEDGLLGRLRRLFPW